jgi:phosphoribosylformylglycinamidine cyclo-ligase
MAKNGKGMTYAASGVDIDAGDTMVDMIRQYTTQTYGPRVFGKWGGFAGLFRLDYNEKLFARNYKEPVLVACTDGVGTKVKLAAKLGVHDTVGIDLVAMSVNDMLVSGAEPLFFLDYLAVHSIQPRVCADMVKGVAAGCLDAGCALLGGETAEMPGVYAPGEFDMAGFAVGVVERKRLIDGSRIQKGDVVLGLASSGIHSNGYSLVRAIVDQKKLDLDRAYDELETDQPLGRVLLTPTRIYCKPILSVVNHYKRKQVVSAMAHITGSGLAENVVRVVPETIDLRIERGSWPVPPVFKFLQRLGQVEDAEMERVFNMGIGFVVIVRPDFADSVQEQLRRKGQVVHRIGTAVKGSGQVKLT